MKHPVLRVKKGAALYDDSEAHHAPRRLSTAADAMVRPSRPRKRRARLTFLPLLILALGIFVVARHAPRPSTDRATLAGWQIILRATPYEDKSSEYRGGALIVGVTFIAVSPTGLAGSAPAASVSVLLLGTGERLNLSGNLEKSPTTLRGRLPYSKKIQTVQAEVSIEGQSRTLQLAAP